MSIDNILNRREYKGIIGKKTHLRLDVFSQVVDIYQKEKRAKHRTLRDTCRDTPPGRLRTVEGYTLMPIENVIFEKF